MHRKYLAAMAMTLGSVACGAAFAADEPAASSRGSHPAPSLSDVPHAPRDSRQTDTLPPRTTFERLPRATNEFNSNIHQFGRQSRFFFQLHPAGPCRSATSPSRDFGGYIDLIAPAMNAKILHYAEDGNSTSGSTCGRPICQYAIPRLSPSWPVNSVTLAGAEVINPTLNSNYSTFHLLFFDSEPLTHTPAFAQPMRWAIR